MGWQSFGPANSYVTTMIVYDGALIVAGSGFQIPGFPSSSIVRWDGAAWTPLPGTAARTLAVYRGDLIAGGQGYMIGGVRTAVTRWRTGAPAWSPVGSLSSGPFFSEDVFALTTFNGELIAGGAFDSPAGLPGRNIARWHDLRGQWLPLGAGVNDDVFSLAEFGGELYAGGVFTLADGRPSCTLARCSAALLDAPLFPVAPADVWTCPGQTISFTAAAAGTPPFEFVWKKGAAPIDLNNPRFGVTISPEGASTTLTITGVLRSDAVSGAGGYRCEATNICGVVPSPTGLLGFRCPADIDCSGTHTVQDLFTYLGYYFATDARADMNSDSRIALQDLFTYLGAYFVPCQ